MYEVEDAVEEDLIGREGFGYLLTGVLSALLAEFGLHALAVLDDIVDTQLEILQSEGFGQEVVGTCLEAFCLVLSELLGREQDDGQMVEVGIALDGARQFVTIHLGHHHVGDYQVDFLVLDNLHGLDTIGGNVDAVVGLQ